MSQPIAPREFSEIPPDPIADAHRRAVAHLQTRQARRGSVGGEVVWNTMLASQYVITCHIVGRELPAARKRRIATHLAREVRADGGWGMHPDSESYLFHTTLAYVALRLLGHAPDEPIVAEARRWILGHGGVPPIPTWGRIWMALLGLYPWDHVQPLLPEMWLQPDASPAHPRRLYCHMRLIYLGLSYVYGARLTASSSPIVEALRAELYPGGYDHAPFAAQEGEIAPTDLYERPGLTLRAAFKSLRGVEKLAPNAVRRRALARALEHILFEFRSTGYVCLSPVNGMLFCLALFAADRGHPELGQGLDGIEYWFWEDDVRGLRIVGARSDIWDSAFLVQALCEGPKTPAARRLLVGLCDWLPRAQLLRDLADGAEHYRSPARGGWGFADEHHPWPVSDCTAEAIEALIRAHEEGFGGLPPARLLDAVRFILHRQNPDGGFGSYEPRRGSMVLKGFNPAEIYGNCMLEYSYTECTASCVRGLATARAHLGAAMPARLHKRVDRAIRDGVERLLASQDRDGGWAGFWGINYTYGTFFVVSALRAVGLAPSHPALTGARRYLLSRQRPDGGWGESYTGMLDGSDRPLPADEPSLVVQTAWAVLALQELDRRAEPVRRAIERGIDYLRARQQEDGSWPRERASGCFFNTAVLEYDLYRQVFPTWALARQLGPRPRQPA